MTVNSSRIISEGERREAVREHLDFGGEVIEFRIRRSKIDKELRVLHSALKHTRPPIHPLIGRCTMSQLLPSDRRPAVRLILSLLRLAMFVIWESDQPFSRSSPQGPDVTSVGPFYFRHRLCGLPSIALGDIVGHPCGDLRLKPSCYSTRNLDRTREAPLGHVLIERAARKASDVLNGFAAEKPRTCIYGCHFRTILVVFDWVGNYIAGNRIFRCGRRLQRKRNQNSTVQVASPFFAL